MLKLRRGTVVEAGEGLVVEVDGDRRPAWADELMVGPCNVGDDVVVNVEALDLALGSGGFDVVHVNLTQGLAGKTPEGPHVMKLNYTSLQHAVAPVEEGARRRASRGVAGVFFLHGQLAPVCWALAHRAPGTRVGFVQTPGGALPGSLSDVVRELRERGLLAGHVTAGAAHGVRPRRSPLRGRSITALARRSGTSRCAGRGPASSARARGWATAG